MEQIEDGLKKMVKAGFGAVATGVEKTQETITKFAKKGEPIYEHAKAAVEETTDKIKKAMQDCPVADIFSCRPRVESLIRDLEEMSREERNLIRAALDEMDAGCSEACENATCNDACTCREESDSCECEEK